MNRRQLFLSTAKAALLGALSGLGITRGKMAVSLFATHAPV
jgi:hypothetical protein